VVCRVKVKETALAAQHQHAFSAPLQALAETTTVAELTVTLLNELIAVAAAPGQARFPPLLIQPP